MPYDIAIIGAARRRQGTGPYVAKFFSELGHRIIGVVGRTTASAENARDQLLEDFQIHTQSYDNLADLTQENNPDIIAICSPSESHLDFIRQALECNCHVFCEKPLGWPLTSHTLSMINTLLLLARQQGRLIHLNTQWPYTLGYFNQLYPDHHLTPEDIKSFRMHLSPESKEAQMLVDSLSHGLSMLYQMVGTGTLSNIHYHTFSESADHIELDFDYQHQNGTTHAQLGLKQTMDSPKPAWYQINNLRIDRQVALPDYQIQLQSRSAKCAIIDPLALSIRDFIASIEANIVCDESILRLGAEHMLTLIQAYNQR